MTGLKSGMAAASLCAFLAASAGCSLLGLSGDDAFWASFKRPERLLVLVEPAIYPALGDRLARYRDDLAARGVSAEVEPCPASSAGELLALIKSKRNADRIDGAFLVGRLPAAWYELSARSRTEEFPFDLYFESLDASWTDSDSDGRFDGHSRLHADIFVSRLPGGAAEVAAYLDKARDYRLGAMAYDRRALLFKDDDWFSFERGSSMGLRRIYSEVDIRDQARSTTRSAYRDGLTGKGIEFVNQWIHSYPSALCVDESGAYKEIRIGDVRSDDYRGLFYNLFDCSASRFTEDNLASTYLLGTGFGLAALGSTKVGGAYDSRAFYGVLSRSGCWGEAFRVWYNATGREDDSWFLGMVIQGDPLLELHPTASKAILVDFDTPPDTSKARRDGLADNLYGFQGGFQPRGLGD